MRQHIPNFLFKSRLIHLFCLIWVATPPCLGFVAAYVAGQTIFQKTGQPAPPVSFKEKKSPASWTSHSTEDNAWRYLRHQLTELPEHGRCLLVLGPPHQTRCTHTAQKPVDDTKESSVAAWRFLHTPPSIVTEQAASNPMVEESSWIKRRHGMSSRQTLRYDSVADQWIPAEKHP